MNKMSTVSTNPYVQRRRSDSLLLDGVRFIIYAKVLAVNPLCSYLFQQCILSMNFRNVIQLLVLLWAMGNNLDIIILASKITEI
jgi:hypothetical protein